MLTSTKTHDMREIGNMHSSFPQPLEVVSSLHFCFYSRAALCLEHVPFVSWIMDGELLIPPTLH